MVGVDEMSMSELDDGDGVAGLAREEAFTEVGGPVAELRALPLPRTTRMALLTRWRPVPSVDAATFRADVDAATAPTL